MGSNEWQETQKEMFEEETGEKPKSGKKIKKPIKDEKRPPKLPKPIKEMSEEEYEEHLRSSGAFSTGHGAFK